MKRFVELMNTSVVPGVNGRQRRWWGECARWDESWGECCTGCNSLVHYGVLSGLRSAQWSMGV